jgi:very-short-patch-repair endonuclease
MKAANVDLSSGLLGTDNWSKIWMDSSNLMLIAIMNNGRDLHIARIQHWYRIPVKSAPKRLREMNYIAFYQTKAFGDQKWSISYWAEIREIRTVKRLELLPLEDDHPKANERYYKVDIGDLKQLADPIASKRGRRIVFIPTTVEKFRAAKEVNDLFHESPLEDKLWYEFKKSGIDAERQYYISEERGRYCLDFAIFCEKGKIDVECNGDTWHSQPETIVRDNARNNFLTSRGWSVLRFSSKDISGNISECLDKVKYTANNLGGIDIPGGESRSFEDDNSDSARQLDLFGEDF